MGTRRLTADKKIKEYRKAIKRKTKPTILIATEGAHSTESIYFKNFNSRNNNYNLIIAKSNVTDPINMINSLISEINKRGIDTKSGDKVYCVIDADDEVSKNKLIIEAITLGKNYGIEVITSNPCFEEWLLCHFENSTKFLTNKEALKNLKKYIPEYTKTLNVFPKVYKYTEKAINNAKYKEKFQLEQGKNINLVEANPSTQVYKIVEELIDKRKEM